MASESKGEAMDREKKVSSKQQQQQGSSIARCELDSGKFPKGQRTDRDKRKPKQGLEKENAEAKDPEADANQHKQQQEVCPIKLVKRLRTGRMSKSEGAVSKKASDGAEGSVSVSDSVLNPKAEDTEVRDDAVVAGDGPSVGNLKSEAKQEEDEGAAGPSSADDAKAPETGNQVVEAPQSACVAEEKCNDGAPVPEQEKQEAKLDEQANEEQHSVKKAEEVATAKEEVKQETEQVDEEARANNLQVVEQQRDIVNAEPDTSLSLGLSGSRPAASYRAARSFQTLSQAETFSNGITTSLSLSCTRHFGHNPSCSLTQTSHENQEFSTATQPVCRDAYEPSQGSWQRSVAARSVSHHSEHGGSQSNKRKASESSQYSPKGSLRKKHVRMGSHGVGLKDAYPSISIRDIVCGPVSVVAHKMNELPRHMIDVLKSKIRDLLECTERREEFSQLQKLLEARVDLSNEVLLSCNRTQLEILVALKTGIKAFLLQERPLQSSLLIEVFLHIKCQNIHCQSQLPVDNCECQVCSQRSGFCNACMCVVCSKFDFDANTCRWVGCDFCLHWCHTECGIRKSYIRPGQSIRGSAGTSEMQFHCVACGHTSELFGFVKDVFTTCAKDWTSVEVLSRELDCVRRMFNGSDDTRGKQLCWKADLLLKKLESTHEVAEVCNAMLKLFEGGDDLHGKSMQQPELEKPLASRGARSFDGDSAAALERATLAIQSYDRALEEKQRTEAAAEIHYERARKKAEIDELESMVRIKQAEAKMFQARADEAAREAEGLQRIVLAKCLKVEEEYNCKKLKLQLEEAEERRRRKFEDLQQLQKGSENFEIMKKLMVDLQSLLRNMEAPKQHQAPTLEACAATQHYS